MNSSRDLVREISRFSLMLHERGWVANHDGNVSARRNAADGFWITPTAISKRLCDSKSIVHCSSEGKAISSGRPPSEIALHVGAYRARPEIKAIIHAHPPQASAFALARRSLSPVAMPEVVVSLGAEIPLMPLVLPKDEGMTELGVSSATRADAVLLTANGVMTMGDDLEQAFLRMELVEHYATIVSLTERIGGPIELDGEAMNKLLRLRAKAGLGPKSAPQYHARASNPNTVDLAAIRPLIAEELRRVLGGSE